MSDRIHRYLITYDIESDAKRAKVAATLESYGDRIQYSVFLIEAKPAKLVRLKTSLTSHLDLQADSLMICDLGPLIDSARLEFVGAPRRFTGQGPLVL